MQAFKIILLGIGSAVLYGILHDQITARVCVEYFTVGHPNIFGTDSPTLLGLGWGIVATWWVGLALGVLLALAARTGAPPHLTAADLVRPVSVLMLASAVIALLAGVTGFALARSGNVWLLPFMATRVPAAMHARYLADLWAHTASYGVGFIGGGILAFWVCVRRIRLRAPATRQATERQMMP